MCKSEKKSLWQKIKNFKRKLFKDKTVALIKVEGIIMDTTGFPLTKKLIKAIKEVEKREIKALVLRVNSPGGTVGASQEIHDALEKLKEKGTTIVASYGDVSASGGVYISVAANKIVSNPGTITGSIGVIINSSCFKDLYKKIGIESEVIKSGPFKDILSSHRNLTEEEKEILQELIDNAYSQFVGVVSKGRDIPEEEVKKFADGRIFTGEQALEHGLVDKLGSLKDAIYYAAELVDIEDEPEVEDLTPKKGAISTLLADKMQAFELMTKYSGIPLWLKP